MTAVEAPAKWTADPAYNLLCRALKVAQPLGQSRVAALVKSRHGVTLEDYHNLPGSDEDKVAFYRECVAALKPQDDPALSAPGASDPVALFRELCKLMQAAGNDSIKRIAAHLRETTGKVIALPNYHADPNIPAEAKANFYSECIAALKNGDLSRLKGDIGKGDKRVDPLEPEPKPEQPAAEPRPAPAVEVTFEPPPGAEVKAPVLPNADRMSPVARAILEEISPFLPKREQEKAQVDAEAVRKIADEVFTKQINNGGLPIERIQKLIDEALTKAATRIEFKACNGTFKPVAGLVHPQVTQLVAWLKAVGCVWAWGAAAGGKTTMARQIAEMLEVEASVFSVDPTTTVAKLMGYRNVSNGEFVPGFLYQPYKNGGLGAADEIDTGDAGVTASGNAMLSNEHYQFPNGETVARHPKFYFLALGNTKGMGAVAGYTARNKLDAATLDRFPIVEVKYDEGLELAVACGVGKPAEPWKPGEPADQPTQQRYVEWVQKVRKQCGNSVLISPRASINGCKALRAGIPMPEVVDALVFKLTTDDSRQRIVDRCGLPYSN